MGVLLEINAGAMVGKVIGLKTGESVTIGRAAGRAQFALPHDTFMSGVHFAVECGPGGCRVQDRQSSNGTFLNGARIQDAMLANGDEIKGGQTIFAVKIVADAKLESLMAPQEVAPSSASQQRSPADAPSPPQQRPRAFEPALPVAREPRPFAAEPAPPAVPPSAGLKEERKPAPPARSATAGPPLSAGAPVGEPEPRPPAMRAADLDEAADSLSAPDAADELAARKLAGAPEPPPARGLARKPEPPAADLSLRAEGPAKSVFPPVEEPPRLRGIPKPPAVGGQPPRAGENLPGVGANPPGAGAKSPRGGEPPAGVAPYIAEKFAERPGSRGAAFSVMGWSFPAAPAEWQVQEGFGLQQSGHEEFPSSVAATEELLGGITLQQFVESQISMLRGYLRDPKIEPTMPPRVGGADESMAMDVRHSTKDGRELVYRRIYARSGSSVGVLTVTTLAADLPKVLQTLQPLLDGAAFRATVNK
jgi:pSer/pThr/pTyr-binding forkhead associated (FHA) protein